MSFPYNQLSTCPTDNSSPLWVLFGPKPLQMPIYCCPNPWPVQSEQKYLGQRLACLAVTPTHLPWNHSLHSLHWTMSLPSSFLFTTQTSIPALVRPTTSSYTKAGTFRAWRGSPRIWLPSVGPGNGIPLPGPTEGSFFSTTTPGPFHVELSWTSTPGVGSGTGYRRSPFPASAGWPFLGVYPVLLLERSAPAICGRYFSHLFWDFPAVSRTYI